MRTLHSTNVMLSCKSLVHKCCCFGYANVVLFRLLPTLFLHKCKLIGLFIVEKALKADYIVIVLRRLDESVSVSGKRLRSVFVNDYAAVSTGKLTFASPLITFTEALCVAARMRNPEERPF